jgi:hypothetical protein
MNKEIFSKYNLELYPNKSVNGTHLLYQIVKDGHKSLSRVLSRSIRNDYFILCKDYKIIDEILKPNKKSEFHLQHADYDYLTIGDKLTKAYTYIYEDDYIEVLVGSLSTTDFQKIIKTCIYQTEISQNERLEILRPIYSQLGPFTERNINLIDNINRSQLQYNIRLTKGKEKSEPGYEIRKGYGIRVTDGKYLLFKNRNFDRKEPVCFDANNIGLNSLMNFLNEDIKAWHEDESIYLPK